MDRGKTIVFIDNSNLFHGSRDAGWQVDMKKLHKYMEKNGSIWQAHLFASVKDPPIYEQTEFYKFIKEVMRYETHIFSLGWKRYYCRNCKKSWRAPVEKGVDVALATKLLMLANSKAFETAILIAADKDYLGTVQAVKSLGLRVEIYAWRGTISQEMENESSAPVVFFNDIRSEIEFKGKPDKTAEEQLSEDMIEEE